MPDPSTRRLVTPIEGHDRHIKGTNKYEDIAGADIVVVTAGLPRKPGMTREDLLALNAKIITEVCANIKKSRNSRKSSKISNKNLNQSSNTA